MPQELHVRPRALGQWPFCRVCLRDSWGSAGEDKRETTVNVLCSASLPLQLLNTRNRSQGRLHSEAKRQNPLSMELKPEDRQKTGHCWG